MPNQTQDPQDKTSLFDKIREVLPANRVAAIVGFLTLVGAGLVTLQTSFVPGTSGAEAIGKAIVILGVLVKAGQIVTKFLEGSQNIDSLLIAGVPKAPGVTVVQNATIEADPEPEDPEGVIPEDGEADPAFKRAAEADAGAPEPEDGGEVGIPLPEGAVGGKPGFTGTGEASA